MKMRFLYLTILACLASIFASCSPYIYGSGRHADVLQYGKKRSEIRSAIGTPIQSGKLSGDGAKMFPRSTYDTFVVQGPVYDRGLANGAAMGTAMTFGLLEIVSFPSSVLWSATSRGLYDVQVTYTPEKEYQGHHVSKSQQKTKKANNAE